MTQSKRIVAVAGAPSGSLFCLLRLCLCKG